VELPPWADGIRLYQQALKRGISIIPGAAFSATDRFHNYIRISCTVPFTGKIEEAIQVLGSLLQNPEA
jgi:DNA-binding transcriptional MocR family regulator